MDLIYLLKEPEHAWTMDRLLPQDLTLDLPNAGHNPSNMGQIEAKRGPKRFEGLLIEAI